MEISPFYKIKSIVVGDAGVGKTSLISLIHHDNHDKDVESTIGLAFTSLQIELPDYPLSNPSKLPNYYYENKTIQTTKDNQLITSHIWDVAGDPRFYNIVKTYLRDVDICFLVFDLTKSQSFENLIKWKKEVDKNSDAVYVLIGNKSDLRNYEVNSNEVKELAEEWGIKYYIITAVQENSAQLVRRIINRSFQDFHEKMLKLEHENKELPKHVQVSNYKKKLELVDVYDTSRKDFCCYH